MKLSHFDYKLDKTFIAQKPVSHRHSSRLLVIDRKERKVFHQYFYQIGDFLNKGDVLVLNDSKVIPARLFGRKDSGAKIEILLLRKKGKRQWDVLLKGKKKKGMMAWIKEKPPFYLEILRKVSQDIWSVRFNLSGRRLTEQINRLGLTPTPPYIKRISNLKEYQTVYARKAGSVAAPTAGFHFSKKLIKQLKRKGVFFEFITLHINLGTFGPIKEKEVEKHKMYSEWAEIKKTVARRLNRFKKEKRRIIAVGTSSCRVLESFVNQGRQVFSGQKEIKLFIYPGYKFRFTDGLITNFHLPKSTNLILVSAFAGRGLVLKAYQEAIKRRYRFYSFGDAMLII